MPGPGLAARLAALLSIAASCAAALVVAFAVTLEPAAAHPLAPALLELTDTGDGRVDVHWKTSRLRPRGAELVPRLPDGCTRTGEPETSGDEQSVSLRWSEVCGAGGLVGRELGVDGLAGVRIDVLVRIALPDGRVLHELLGAGRDRLAVPAQQTRRELLVSYGRLGVEHILAGPDHLMFVFGLLWLVSGVRRLVQTITAFTVGHSVTLTLATLGLARVPASLAELGIAASILVLAVELASPAKDPPRALRRWPWGVAFGFGLLHGLGFAGALAEIGLPQQEIPLALFAFNVGIELGQLAFVAGCLALLAASGWLSRRVGGTPAWLARVPAYAIGCAAAYWCFERAGDVL